MISADLTGSGANDIEKTDVETVIIDLLGGQYSNPVAVFGFNASEGWCRDVSEDVAQELRRRCDLQDRDLPGQLQEFVERHEGGAAGGK